MWDRIKEIYQKYKIPSCILAIDFVVARIFVKPNDEPCIGRCLVPISETYNIVFTIAMFVALICFIWIAILYVVD